MIYCKECGRQIEADSKFCFYCGNSVSQLISKKDLEKEMDFKDRSKESDIQNTPKVVKLLNNLSVFFGVNYLTLIVYFSWLVLNIFMLIFYDSNNFGNRFWPFDKYSVIQDYSLSEFLIFTLLPLFLMVFYVTIQHYIKEQKTNSSQSLVKQKKISNDDPDSSPIKILSIIGVLLLILNLLSLFYDGFNRFIIQNPGDRIFILVARIIGIIIVAQTARNLNRSILKWSIFAFFLPTISLIFIGFKSRLLLKSKLYKNYSDVDLSSEYVKLVVENRREWGGKHMVEILKKAISLNPENHEAFYQLARVTYLYFTEPLLNSYLERALELGSVKAAEVYNNNKY